MGLLRKLFGGGKKRVVRPGGAPGDKPTRTLEADTPVRSGPRVRPIGSEEFAAGGMGQIGPLPHPGGKSPMEEDTGPYFIGKTVGELYQIRGVLGRGGMGIVYRAYDTATQRDVAVKVPLDEAFQSAEGRKRFTQEAQTWSGLIHPHIVCAFGVRDDETTDYRPAVFMEFCDGGSLAGRLRRGPGLSVAEALDVAIQVCWGMEFAHQQGHIHRDLKPGNVLLTSQGKALGSDFGLVKSLGLDEVKGSGQGLEGLEAQVRTSLTRGLAVGTAAYMPPEQWAGRASKHSDVYAFGVMLYELFCGRLPFEADSLRGFCAAHWKVAPPDPRRLNGRLPPELAELMVACLTKDPAGRPGSFGEVAEQLSEAYGEVSGQAHAVRRRKPSGLEVSTAQRRNQASFLIGLGLSCFLWGDLDDAMRHFLKARKIFRETKIGGPGELQIRVGDVWFIEYEGLDGLIDVLETQQKLWRELGNKDALTDALQGSPRDPAYVVRGQLRGKLDAAMKILKERERACRASGNAEGLAISLINQASLLGLRMGRPGLALPLAEEAYRLASGHGLAALAGKIQGILDKVRAAGGR